MHDPDTLEESKLATVFDRELVLIVREFDRRKRQQLVDSREQ